LLFTTSTGQPIEPRNLKRSFDARCAKAGVRQIKIHDTRRACGSLAALDVHPRVAMAILRHSRIALTMDIYTQVPDKTTKEALKRLSDWLDTPGSGGQLVELREIDLNVGGEFPGQLCVPVPGKRLVKQAAYVRRQLYISLMDGDNSATAELRHEVPELKDNVLAGSRIQRGGTLFSPLVVSRKQDNGKSSSGRMLLEFFDDRTSGVGLLVEDNRSLTSNPFDELRHL
jgi:hypothetical protein